MYHCWTSLHFLTSWNVFDFCEWFQKKWVLFKLQEGKPLASKKPSESFPIEFCSKHMQWGFQSHNREFVKHEQGYQWGQHDGTNKVVLVTLLFKLKKEYTFLPFYVCISELRMGGYLLKTYFLNMQFKKSSGGTVLNFPGNRHSRYLTNVTENII